jgi:predicted RNase H-like HicB family nuclease
MTRTGQADSMDKHLYTAIFSEETDGFSVCFPDLEGCFTEGDTLEEAYLMAEDALGLYLLQQDGTFHYPPAKTPSALKESLGDKEFTTLIEFDEAEYRKRHDSKAVKKTLTIPSWLNYEAERLDAPFSRILQDGLKNYLKTVR